MAAEVNFWSMRYRAAAMPSFHVLGLVALQAATHSGKPVLLRIDEQAGHGIGSTIGQAISKQADVYAFLLWQFGLAKLRG